MPIRRGTRILLWTLLAIGLIVGIGFVYLLTIPAPLEHWLQARMLLALQEHYQADVQVQNLRVTLIPFVNATADNFVLPNRNHGDVPPLITVKHLTVEANLLELLLRSPVHLSVVKLDGMEIKVAPKRKDQSAAAAQKPKYHTRLANFLIDRVEADGTMLYILRKDPTEEPMLFELRKLALRSAGVGQPMTFVAELTNPTPPGLIHTKGHFGPWDFDEPSSTKVDGHYDFQHADLSVFPGISGILASVGDYTGMLNDITVDGTTDVPDFQLDHGGQPVHLTTKFHAVVDGTNGNTYLQPVNAHFLHTDISTRGEVAGQKGKKGKTIQLDVDMQKALVQDVLVLASKTPPMLTGQLMLQAKLLLPPGKEPVLQKMQLNGRFSITAAQFAQPKIKDAVTDLSRRGQGKPKDTTIDNVASEFRGDFTLRHSTLNFGSLQFVEPGAQAQVKGSYGLNSGEINFVGEVRLDAKVSETMTGAKHILLKPFDPLFNKHGAGTWLPVEINGTRDKPDINVQWKKLF